MDKEKYCRYRRRIIALEILLLLMGFGTIYLLTKNMVASWVAAVVLLLGVVLTEVQNQLADKYIVSIAADLSELCDSLITLEERELFPMHEDTILSKLQNKIMKLVRILKKKNEISLREQENVKALVSDISHQLKTPIANLLMYSAFLEDKSLSDEKRHEYVGVIRLSVDRLNFLSESMIKVSRLESGLIHLNMQKQNFNETALKAVKDVYLKAKRRGTEIVYHEEQQITLSHDRNWTAEAIFNLLDNAVKYAECGSKIHLTVKMFGMFAAVEVTDENVPIPEEEKNKIFSRFYRGINSRNQEGIGIGLYLSREIVVKQGGYMNLKTTAKGNTFSIVLHCGND